MGADAPAAPFSPSPDPTGTWQWSAKKGDDEVRTTLKLALQDSKIAGVYSNQFGDAAIDNVSLQDHVIGFQVVRDFGGWKYLVRYHGKLEGDTILGTIEVTHYEGGDAVKLAWNAKRTTKDTVDDAKQKD